MINYKYIKINHKFHNFIAAFTLIELLVVVAVLGVMGTITFMAIDPFERLAQARDMQRIENARQLMKAVEAYFITYDIYPDAVDDAWITTLLDEGEIKAIPPSVDYPSSFTDPCNEANETFLDPLGNPVHNEIGNQNNYCLQVHGNNLTDPYTLRQGIVSVQLESRKYISRCPADNIAFYIYNAFTKDITRHLMCCNSSGSTCNFVD